jgi:hypothetical protein
VICFADICIFFSRTVYDLDTMKLFLVLSCFLVSSYGAAFAPMMPKTTFTQHHHQLVVEPLHAISRREALIGVVGVATGAAWAHEAFAYQSATASQAGIGSDRGFANDFEVIAAQQPTGGRVDVNAAPVVSGDDHDGVFSLFKLLFYLVIMQDDAYDD